jgi:hypothetical protein
MLTIYCQVEHCIEEWASGSRVKAKFEASSMLPGYKANVEKLIAWQDLNPPIVNKIHLTLYKRCMYGARSICSICTYLISSRFAGVNLEYGIPAMTDDTKEAAKLELEGRTGETESESDQSQEV